MKPIDRITALLSGVADTEQAPVTHSGMIVALRIPPHDAEFLSVPGGEAANELHVTLAFLGSSADLGDEDVNRYAAFARELSALARRVPPLTLTVTGAGTFPAADKDGNSAHYLDVDGPGLRTLREEVMAAAEHVGLSPSRKFPDFHPHVTLSYAPAGRAHPHPDPDRHGMRIPDLELWLGGVRVRWPFAAQPHALLAKADTGNRGDTRDAQAMLAQLTGDLIHATRDESRLQGEVNRLARHHEQAAYGLGHVIRAPRGSAVEDAYLEHAAEAHAARTLAGRA